MNRKIKEKMVGSPAIDGAGVHLTRVLGHSTVAEFDPVLMLDSFDSVNPKDYIAGFPMHPHRGIETISYVYRGKMMHRDNIGFEDTISDGEVQWMTAGSGILHEEKLPASERMLGLQLWLNLPAKDKMCTPKYRAIKNEEIPEISVDGGMIRLLAGKYREYMGFQSEHLPVNYYDVTLEAGAELSIPSDMDESITLFTLLGEVYVEGELVKEKVAVKLTEGDTLHIKAGENGVKLMYFASKALKEPVAWGGPIVMNTREELYEAFRELDAGTFMKR